MPPRHKPNTSRQSRAMRDIIAQGKALQKLGLYKSSQKFSVATPPNKKQQKTIKEKFDRLQSHGQFVQGIGTVRPLQRRARSYQLTPYFRTTKNKIKTQGYDVIPTGKGSIIPTKLGTTKNLPDNAFVTHQFLLGEKRKVISKTMTAKETVLFIRAVKKGKYDIPKGYYMRMRIFDSSADDIMSSKDLLAYVTKYGPDLRSLSRKDFNALTIDMVQL